jgi:CheY-like chemotaxis protein
MGSRMHISVLLLDDSRSDVQLTRHWLKSSRTIGAVHAAYDSGAAMELLRRPAEFVGEFPRLILLDLNLRGGSGWDVLRQIKSDPALARLSVVILSASVFPEDRQRAAAEGASLYLNKPAGAAEFAQLVQDLDAFCQTHFRLSDAPNDSPPSDPAA